MSVNETSPSDDGLEEALAAYEAALESGDTAGIEAVLRRYGHLRVDLKQYAANRSALNELAQPLRDAAAGADGLPNVDGYEVLELLDSGGMGLVYRARYERLNRVVALKVIRSDRFVSGEDLQRFQTEAKSAAEIDHQGVVSVYDIGQQADGRPYYSMELVQGESLKDLLALRGPLRPREAARLLFEIAEAMAAAHRDGIVHRDLKPGNILVDRYGHPRIIDFGLAKQLDEQSDVTLPGAFLGTWAYMSPEQADGRGHLAGPPADVHALGAILYEMLTGQTPFVGANEIQTRDKVRHNDPLPPHFLEQDVPRDLEAICMMCLRKDPQQRYADAGELADDLERFLHNRNPRAVEQWVSPLDWMTRSDMEDPITQMAPYYWGFLACYTSCLAIAQVLLLMGRGEPLIWLLVCGGAAPLFLILRTDDSPGILPANPSERILWSIWLGVVISTNGLCVAMRLGHDDFVTAFHQAFAVAPFLTGLGFFIMGGSFWIRNCFWGLGWMALGILMPVVVPEPWSLTVYAAYTALAVANIAILQHRLARQAKGDSEPGYGAPPPPETEAAAAPLK